MTDALVPPLCFMLENLIEAQDHKSSTEQNRMIAYVSENFAAMTLDSLSAYLGRSRSYISHLFKKTTGKSLRAYCNELKLFTSEKLLRSTEMTVTEIAFESGFEDTSYFVSIFKDKYGMTPYKYRKNHLTEFN